jgi:hypothetical protein
MHCFSRVTALLCLLADSKKLGPPDQAAVFVMAYNVWLEIEDRALWLDR